MAKFRSDGSLIYTEEEFEAFVASRVPDPHCRGECGHPESVHDEDGCHGEMMVGGEWCGPGTCRCTKFVGLAPPTSHDG